MHIKLIEQFCTLQQSKRLKELGINISSPFCWSDISSPHEAASYEIRFNRYTSMKGGKPCEHYFAFTSADLGIMLPNGFYTKKPAPHLSNQGYRLLNKWYCSGGVMNLSRKSFTQTTKSYNTEAEARAEMLIHLLENNLVTAEEINKKFI